jgi:hypothetical protein
MHCSCLVIGRVPIKALGAQWNPIARRAVWRGPLVDGQGHVGRSHASGIGHVGELFLPGASAVDPRLLAVGGLTLMETP